MMYFRQTVMSQITSASSEDEINDVVNDSIIRLQLKNVNGYLIERYITSMSMTLAKSRQEAPGDHTKHKVEFALTLFRELQRSK